MPAAIPQHIRERIVEAYDKGTPREAIIRKFGLSSAFIRRLLQRRRETGRYSPKPHAGGRAAAVSGVKLK
jgi:transposase